MQHHTVDRKSLSSSPHKAKYKQETPEWKRRLIHGEVAYGDQRDLFSPAGLENIFKPPPPRPSSSPVRFPTRLKQNDETFMPSSPPPYNIDRSENQYSFLTEEDEGDQGMQKEKRPLRYKMTESDPVHFSDNDLDRGSTFLPVPSISHTAMANPQPDTLDRPEEDQVQAASDPHLSVKGAARQISGQSYVQHEELSPIYVSRHGTVAGADNHAASKLPADELHQRLQSLSMEDESPQSEPSGVEAKIAPPPLDATINTEDFAHNGNFVNLDRGGYLDASFQQKMLSSASLPIIDESIMLQEESVQASTPKEPSRIQRPRTPNSPALPTTPPSPPYLRVPDPSPIKGEDANSRPSTGASHLKLFGDYDTFTNQKLLRRLSQFEQTNGERSDASDSQDYSEIYNDSAQETPSNFDDHAPANIPDVPRSSPRDAPARPDASQYNLFGDGNLDEYEFSEEVSFVDPPYGEASNGEAGEPSKATTGASDIFKFELEQSNSLADRDLTRVTRTKETTITTTKHTIQNKSMRRGSRRSIGPTTSSTSQVTTRVEMLATPRKNDGAVEGKRLRSPQKERTPKRRRTLHDSDIASMASRAVAAAAADMIQENHQTMQQALGRKRKDSRHSDDQVPATPEVLATRQILRPRTASGSGHGTGTVENDPKSSLNQQKKIAKIQAEIDGRGPLKAIVNMGVDQSQDQSRKPSVTTQDFFDEAAKIMGLIRDKARSRTGLNNVEESGSDGLDSSKMDPEEQEDSYQESTQEPFSRPPSRENAGPLPRLPRLQEDPDIISHLKRFEDTVSSMEGILPGSMQSISLAKQAALEMAEAERRANETIHRASLQSRSIMDGYCSDPPGVQITEYPELQRKRKHSTSSGPLGEHQADADFDSQSSNASSRPSTGQSIPTNSSRGSDSRRVIAPHTVSHLIPELAAGMVLDKEKGAWVKRKDVEAKTKTVLPSDDSEEDPFGDIPDLTVDEAQEMERLKEVAARKREEQRLSDIRRYQQHSYNHAELYGAPGSPEPIKLQPPALASDLSSASDPSRFTNLGFSAGLASGTRLTSWVDDLAPSAKIPAEPTKHEHEHEYVHGMNPHSSYAKKELVEEFDQEISINESRVDLGRPKAPRKVTISFSSPLASFIHSDSIDRGSDFGGEESMLHTDWQSEEQEQGKGKPVRRPKTRSTLGTASRHISVGGIPFVTRPVSRIDEREEESLLERFNASQRDGNVGVVVATPDPPRSTSGDMSMVVPSAASNRTETLLNLTPLSDFTMHQQREEFALEVSYVAEKRQQRRPSDRQRSLSLSVKDLVQGITDVEPYEPFWEHMKQIDLKAKKLQTLHMLAKFCGQLEEVDVSNNEIGQLDGAPESIRHLKIAHNCLSDLTSWNLLRNLQYLDVSNNNITCLNGFRDLVHLRSLRADNNRIQSVDGIKGLDGLISLRLRNNLLEHVDFKGSSLHRLTDLDLKGNLIEIVENIHELQSLIVLNLEDNLIENFSAAAQESVSLKYLKLSNNNLDHIDVSNYPNLRLLYLDGNRIEQITGLLTTKHLDSLSLREQREGSNIDVAFLDEAFEVRKLFLSGNLLTRFAPRVDFPNLQYLELANCGLEELSADFGQLMSNVRVLNLNFNALKDITPLLCITRLKKLHLAGNRLTRLRKTTNVLAQFACLARADLRGNPLTLGFYLPATGKQVVAYSSGENADDAPRVSEPFTLDDGDAEKDCAYAARLDMETKMRRRMFEILVLCGCMRLKVLDGLPAQRERMHVKDQVWQELVDAGVLLCDPIAITAAAAAVDNGAPLSAADVALPTIEEEEVEASSIAPAVAAEEIEATTMTLEGLWGVEDSFA